MDQFALQKAYAAQAAQANAYISQNAGISENACRETEFNTIANRLSNLIARSENLSIHLSDTSDRLLGSAAQTPGSVQGSTPRPVPNGIVQTISMGLDMLEVNLDRASNLASRLSGAI